MTTFDLDTVSFATEIADVCAEYLSEAEECMTGAQRAVMHSILQQFDRGDYERVVSLWNASGLTY